MNLFQRIRQWCLDRDIWTVKLDTEIPEACLAESQRLYDEGFFVEHRDGTGHGWKSCALWGWARPGESLEDAWRNTTNPKGAGLDPERVEWGWTGIQEIAPETKRWLSEFPGNHLRCRFMLLEPGGSIDGHVDHPHRDIWGAVNVAFNQPRDCWLRRIDTQTYFPYEPFSAYYFDKGVPHDAANESSERRFHFIVSGSPDEVSKHLMIRSLIKTYGRSVLADLTD